MTAMHHLRRALTVGLIFAACGTAAAAPTIIEARLTYAKWRSMEMIQQTQQGSQKSVDITLPQLRIYDRDGRLLRDLTRGFAPDTFDETLRGVARKPIALKQAALGLPAELQVVERPDGTPVGDLPKADLIFVEYWADWCQPCHQQYDKLKEFMTSQKKLTTCLVHVEADSSKAYGVGGMPPSAKGLPGPPRSPAAAGSAAPEAAPTAAEGR